MTNREKDEYMELFDEAAEADGDTCSCGRQYYHCVCRMSEKELNYYNEWEKNQ
jgi:hypothetical protein